MIYHNKMKLCLCSRMHLKMLNGNLKKSLALWFSCSYWKKSVISWDQNEIHLPSRLHYNGHCPCHWSRGVSWESRRSKNSQQWEGGGHNLIMPIERTLLIPMFNIFYLICTLFCCALFCFGNITQFLVDLCDNCTHILQGCFTGTGAIVWLPQCQWSNSEGHG